MKKVLFALLICLFMIPSVNAATYDTCYDEYKIAENISWSMEENYHRRMLVKLPLTAGTTYYLKFWNLNLDVKYLIGSLHYYYDSNDKLLASNSEQYVTVLKMSSDGVLTYKFKNNLSNASYFYLSFYIYTPNGYYRPNSEVILTLSTEELNSCPVVEEPEPEPIVPDSTLDSFYSIYTSKLKQFTEYALENKYVLGALGIILLFIVLEIVLNLFRKGGYR